MGGNSEPKIVGVRHGAGQAFFDEEFYNLHPHFRSIFYPDTDNDKDWWKKWVKYKSYGNSLSKIKMYKSAKHTDYINSGVLRGMFINTRFKEILQTCHLPNHEFFEITFLQGEKLIDGYWWFCFDYETGENSVDFSKCQYNLRDHKRVLGEDFTADIQTYEDYLDVFYETSRAVKITELVFNSNFDYKLDIFGTQFLTNQTYISTKLNRKLQQQNITGYIANYPVFELDYLIDG